jgi:hypothetical protein
MNSIHESKSIEAVNLIVTPFRSQKSKNIVTDVSVTIRQIAVSCCGDPQPNSSANFLPPKHAFVAFLAKCYSVQTNGFGPGSASEVRDKNRPKRLSQKIPFPPSCEIQRC